MMENQIKYKAHWAGKYGKGDFPKSKNTKVQLLVEFTGEVGSDERVSSQSVLSKLNLDRA